jgi:hypothetical protein
MIFKLADNELVGDIFRDEFDSIPPSQQQGSIIAVVNNGQIDAFVMAEALVRVGLLWVNPAHRQSYKSIKLTKELISYIKQGMPPDSSVVTIDESGRFGNIFKHLGLREVEGKLYRIDL